MQHPVKAPSVGESITEVSVLKWTKQSGQAVKSGDLLLEIESDKATVEIVAEQSGVLQILKQPGERVPVGEVIGMIDDAGSATVTGAAPAVGVGATSAGPARPAAAAAAAAAIGATPGPAARKLMAEAGTDPTKISGTGKDGRITKGDLLAPAAPPAQARGPAPSTPAPTSTYTMREGDRRVPMTMLRAKIAERLVHAQHTAAILTTFNEVDMGPVMEFRTKNKDAFKAKYGVGLGFMSFFARACVEALKQIPEVNATIDGKDVIYHDYYDVGIAVGTERGLVVPIVRNAGALGIPQIEQKIAELALKARDGKLGIADMSGGTFTISNGGVYGSMLSTPILNPPQSGILGMHKIQERPMAINGQVVIRPMMFLALSYDHRLIDGKGAVTFLVVVKDLLENPTKLGLDF